MILPSGAWSKSRQVVAVRAWSDARARNWSIWESGRDAEARESGQLSAHTSTSQTILHGVSEKEFVGVAWRWIVWVRANTGARGFCFSSRFCLIPHINAKEIQQVSLNSWLLGRFGNWEMEGIIEGGEKLNLRCMHKPVHEANWISASLFCLCVGPYNTHLHPSIRQWRWRIWWRHNTAIYPLVTFRYF